MNVTPQDLLDAGTHFGHQKRRWNPRSKPFIYEHRDGISIIDLEKTYNQLQKACEFLKETVAGGGNVLLIGTKRQAQEVMKEAAAATQMPYCVGRWLGGTLTNFVTVKASVIKYRKLIAQENDGTLAKLPKKELSAIKRDMARMQRNFEGILEMMDLPTAVFIVDTKHEAIAVHEAERMGIKSVGLVDTNSDPTKLTFPIPGNDDAVKSIRVVVNAIVAAIQEGFALREQRKAAPRVNRIEPRLGGAQTSEEAAEGVSYTLPPGVDEPQLADEAAGTAGAAVRRGRRRPSGVAAPKPSEPAAPEAPPAS
jgi:small subunit ribosomal protein S2